MRNNRFLPIGIVTVVMIIALFFANPGSVFATSGHASGDADCTHAWLTDRGGSDGAAVLQVLGDTDHGWSGSETSFTGHIEMLVWFPDDPNSNPQGDEWIPASWSVGRPTTHSDGTPCNQESTPEPTDEPTPTVTPVIYSLEVSGGGNCAGFNTSATASPEGASIVFNPRQNGTWEQYPAGGITITSTWTSTGHVETRIVTITRPSAEDCDTDTGNPPPGPEVKVEVVPSTVVPVAPKKVATPKKGCLNEEAILLQDTSAAPEIDQLVYPLVDKGSVVEVSDKPVNTTRDAKLVGQSTNGSFSPDMCEMTFSFVPEQGGESTIWVVDLAGESPRQVLHHKKPVVGTEPDWGPNWTIAFRGSDGQLYLTDSWGSFMRPLKVQGYDPDISPDGKWIAYTNSNFEMAFVAINGSGQGHVTHIKADRLVWLPDMSGLVYGAGEKLMLLDFASGQTQPLMNGVDSALDPDGSGKYVAIRYEAKTAVFYQNAVIALVSTRSEVRPQELAVVNSVQTSIFDDFPDWGDTDRSKCNAKAFVAFVNQ